MTALHSGELSAGALVTGTDGGGRFVTRAKNWRSAFNVGQGREPRRPMPSEGVVATISVKGGRPCDGEGVVEVDIVKGCVLQ